MGGVVCRVSSLSSRRECVLGVKKVAGDFSEFAGLGSIGLWVLLTSFFYYF